MKLKIYKLGTITALFISLFLSIVYFVKAIIFACNASASEVMDSIMYILCFVLLIAFIILEIVNTFISIKKGSQFVRNLAYNDGVELNGNFLKIIGGLTIIFFALLIYIILLLSGLEIPLNDISKEIQSIMLCYTLVIVINFSVILLYPILGKDDIV